MNIVAILFVRDDIIRDSLIETFVTTFIALTSATVEGCYPQRGWSCLAMLDDRFPIVWLQELDKSRLILSCSYSLQVLT